MKKEKQKNKSGFTLVEVLVVITLIAILGGIGGGFHFGTYRRVLVEKTARDLFLAAKYARIMAIEKQIPCSLELDTTNGAFFLTYDRFNEETGTAEQTIVRDLYSKPVEFSENIKFEDIMITSVGLEETEEKTQIVFYPNGTAQSAVIQIGDGENHYTVSIYAATGKAVVQPGTVEEVQIKSVDLDEV